MNGRDHQVGNVSGPVQTGNGVQYNAGRDQYVAGGDMNVAGRDQVVSGGDAREIVAALAELRQALGELRLTAAERDSAMRDLDAIDGAVRRREPDAGTIGNRLHSFTSGLKEAGALASAGASLATAIGTIAVCHAVV